MLYGLKQSTQVQGREWEAIFWWRDAKVLKEHMGSSRRGAVVNESD